MIEEELRIPESGREHSGEVPPVNTISKELLDLPNELLPMILEAFKYESTRGATESHALHKAAENIRNLFFTNQLMKEAMGVEWITQILIHELANRFAGGNVVRAALALGTDTASKWLAKHYNDEKIQEQAIIQLIIACQDGQVGAVRFLTQYLPAWLNKPIINGTVDGITPLMAAAKNNHYEIARLLIEKGADVNRVGHNDATALIYAVQSNNPAIVDLLIASKADVDAQLKDRRSPLMIASRIGNISIIDSLLKAHAAIDLPDHHDRTALFYAVLGQHKDAVEKLLSVSDTNVNAVDQFGITPLMLAVKGNFEIVKLLADKGAALNLHDEDGDSALHFAQRSNHPDKIKVINFLRSMGARIIIQ